MTLVNEDALEMVMQAWAEWLLDMSVLCSTETMCVPSHLFVAQSVLQWLRQAGAKQVHQLVSAEHCDCCAVQALPQVSLVLLAPTRTAPLATWEMTQCCTSAQLVSRWWE